MNKVLDLDVASVIEASFDGIIISEANGTVLLANSSVERITGTKPAEYIGKSVDELLKKEIIPYATGLESIRIKKPFTRIQKYKNGKTALVTSNPIFDHAGKPLYIVTNVRDVTLFNNFSIEYAESNESLVGVFNSTEINKVIEILKAVAIVDSTVLFLGETGVGKDVLANFLHNISHRKHGKFVKINCGTLPESLLESELFGYEAGAFTGAQKNGKEGLVEVADKGTLFFDEVGELPLRLQPKLLELLQDFQFNRVGGLRKRKVNIRVIAATNRDLASLVKEKQFREDLYYRLNVVPVHVPPLRKRVDDIIPLTRRFLEEFNYKYGLNKGIDSEVFTYFLQYPWPGNIRELRNTIERLVVTTKSAVITKEQLPEEMKSRHNEYAQESPTGTLKSAKEEVEKKLILEALSKGYSTYKIAKMLGTSQPTIFRKIKKYTQQDGEPDDLLVN